MKTCDTHGSFAGACAVETSPLRAVAFGAEDSPAPHEIGSIEQAAHAIAERFFQFAPAMAAGESAEIRAEIVGDVRYRQGDGVLLKICSGRVSVEVCSCDAVLSWADDDCRWNASMPFVDFHRYVVDGAIRLHAYSDGGTPTAALLASADEVWGELAAIPRIRCNDSRTTLSLFHDPVDYQECTMSQRLDYYKASREATNAMLSLEQSVNQFGFDQTLLELVRLRASQLNGCAYCVDHHVAEARKAGESDRRLHSVVVWRETPFFTERERAALAWTESLTQLADTHAPDEDYALVREQFSDKEIVDLTVAIIAVNGWNRLGVGFRRSPEA